MDYPFSVKPPFLFFPEGSLMKLQMVNRTRILVSNFYRKVFNQGQGGLLRILIFFLYIQWKLTIPRWNIPPPLAILMFLDIWKNLSGPFNHKKIFIGAYFMTYIFPPLTFLITHEMG